MTQNQPFVVSEPEALLEALRPLHEEAFYWALRLAGGDEDLAADALQGCYLKVLEGRAVFNGESSLKTWFFSVIRYTLMELRRPSLRLVEAGPEPEDESAVAQDTELVRAETGSILKQLFARLSGQQQQIVSLVFYHRTTIEEAADVMGVSVGTARTHYERAKSNLKQLINRYHLKEELDHG